MKTFYFFAAVILFSLGIFIFGCDESDNMVQGSKSPITAVVSISPADGTTGVPTNASVSISFSGPIDTLSVMSNIHLAGGQPMHEWLDSLNHYGGFGMMSMNMAEHMLNWIDSIHTPGQFHWNAELDSCEFIPDSALQPSTDYFCIFDERNMHDYHGGMMGGENHDNSGYHLYGFSTAP